jgi:hypothetical protein
MIVVRLRIGRIIQSRRGNFASVVARGSGLILIREDSS